MKKIITASLLTILIGCDLPQADKPAPVTSQITISPLQDL